MNLPNLSEEKFLNIILYGNSLFSDCQNQSILNSTIKVYNRFKPVGTSMMEKLFKNNEMECKLFVQVVFDEIEL